MASEETRLGIPIIFGIDAVHGNAFFKGATIFPNQLAMASSWNKELFKKAAQVTAMEVILTGLHWTFSPILCLGRDTRWGRVDETFGEDPYLAGVLADAMIKGYQGEDLSDPYSILACAKHFVAHGETVGGRDSTESDVSERKLRTTFFPPFKAAVDSGCATFMAAYHANEGVPASANKWLLNDILKEEWGFKGFVVTDWDNITYLHKLQKVAPTMKKACEIAIISGNDMMMATKEFCDCALELVKEGTISEDLIDSACTRILNIKFKLGLFDNKRYPEVEKAKIMIGCNEHKKVAYEGALESIILLKNENKILPLSNKVKKIAVIGPNADDIQAQLGDWCFGPRSYPDRPTIDYREADTSKVVTIIEGIRKRAGNNVEVLYEKGCHVIDENDKDIEKAVDIANQSDVIFAVMGDTVTLFGEQRDRAKLDLSGAQQELLEALKRTGKPLVVILIAGKPLTISWIKENADAIIEAWNPGAEGGNAVASILFGDYNPSGKLTISFPAEVGQLPVYYNQNPGWHGGKYIDVDKEPLFSFGYGLSYTSYEYSNLTLSHNDINKDGELEVSIDVKNTGKYKGTEIVQFYMNDIYSSVTTPIKELRGFERVTLNPGESKKVVVKIPVSSFALVDSRCKYLVEPGEFEIMVGSSSRDDDLLKAVININ